MQEIKNRTTHHWGVILAGGDGTRLRSLTRLVSADERPKQFCPLLGGRTLLSQTRLRTARNIDIDRTVFSLTRSHESFYATELAKVPQIRMVVQPSNRGTLPAILWSLLRILRLDKDAVVTFFPSDHFYSEEEKFMAGVAAGFDLARANAQSVILLGAVAKRPESEYGWIEPEAVVCESLRRAADAGKTLLGKALCSDCTRLAGSGLPLEHICDGGPRHCFCGHHSAKRS